MSTLFSNNNSESGYRLRYLEIFNWGTFHGKVYRVETNSRTSLLTGANGSGKTTLIDALLTLLVPSNKRFYNQSSGAEFKKERDELSYFWGYYGKTYSDSDERSQTEQLRNKSDNTYSVLLACFQNTGTQHTITLAQVRWFSNGGLRKVFIVSPYQLNIAEHFGKGRFDIKGEWKKKLTKQFPKTDLFESFKEYSSRFSEIFGLKEKALSLFNQTVGIKVLGDLTVFVRQQMLEEPESEEQFKNLHDHYTDLLLAHKAIQKDEKQLELLEPIIQNKIALAELYEHRTVLNYVQEQLPLFLSKVEYDLIDDHIKNVTRQIDYLENEKKVLDDQIGKLSEEQTQLITQKALLNIDSQIQLLQKDVSSEKEKRDEKKGHCEGYLRFAKVLGLKTNLDEEIFQDNKVIAERLNESINEEYDKLTDEKTRYRIDRDAKLNQIESLQNDISSLLNRKNRIPRDLVEVRQRLLDILETGEDELPFVGELIKVKENEKHWEDAIERVLHGFSMRLLVPDRLSRQVNQFAYSNDLGAKLVYEKIDRRSFETLIRWPNDSQALINKIELQDNSYKKWLETYLLERFNYHCTDDLEVFYNSSKAVTSNGLLRNTSRHEKDDRPGNWNKSKFRLGWDNKESIKFLQEQKSRLESDCNRLSGELANIVPKIKSIEERRTVVVLMSSIKSYNEIHWQQHAEKIQSLTKQIEDLKKSSDKYETICLQLERVNQELKEKRDKKDDISGNLKSNRRDLDEKNKRKLNIQFEGLKEDGVLRVGEYILQEQIKNTNPNNFDQLEIFKKEVSTSVRIKHSSLSQTITNKEFDTIGYVNAFIHPDAKILNEFPDWSGDVMNIDANLRSLEELEDLHKAIKNQRLVEHKRRFKEYMDKSMLDALTNFRTWLTNEEDKIKEVIEELNVPLKKITFNKHPDTYLQLESRATKEQEIKLFREQLSATIPNALEFATQKDDTYREAVFSQN